MPRPLKNSVSNPFFLGGLLTKANWRLAVTFILLVSVSGITNAQNFTNSDLDGTVFSFSELPDGWDPVVVGDPVCLASNANIGDTPDLCTATEPNLAGGLGGFAFSGNTFLCGLRMNGPSVDFHEGIQQTVNGLVIGESYAIEFYQTVVKQSFAIDMSGSWSVYMDNDLLAVSDPSTSSLAFDDPNLQWDARSVTFVPTATSHIFKFLPTDDDANLTQSFDDDEGALRMGIDLITINTDCALDLGPDVTLCESELPLEIGTALAGTYEWNTDETSSSILVSESGTYILEVSSACGLIIDSISVEILEDLDQVDLGEDLELCPQDFPIEITADVEGEYIWNTFEQTQSIIVNEPGEYTVTVFNDCGAVFDSIEISEGADGPSVSLGADITACADDFPITLDPGLYDSYSWATGEETQSISVSEPGSYAVTVSNSCGSAIDEITVALVDPPAEISLGDDFSICENQFPTALEIEATDLAIAWSTGSVEQMINVNTAGVYSVEVSNLCGASSASINISSIPNPQEEESFILCQGESVEFLGETFSEQGQYEVILPAAAVGDCDTFWNIDVNVIPTDTISELLQIGEGEIAYYNGNAFDESGLYFLNESIEGECDRVVRVLVDIKDEVFVYVPSAFTPDDDGINDLFKPEVTLVGDIDLSFFEFEIYDRFGHIIYETEDAMTAGWNGSGAIDQNYYVQDGVYTWVLRYSTTRGTDKEILYGSVVMVR